MVTKNGKKKLEKKLKNSMCSNRCSFKFNIQIDFHELPNLEGKVKEK